MPTIKHYLKKFIGPVDSLDIELLYSHVAGKTRESILADHSFMLDKNDRIRIDRLLNKRAKGKPLAYLTGHKEFYGLDFIVDKSVLIPRPETELIIDEALKSLTQDAERTTILDIGTGSGCIIITLAKLLEAKNIIKKFDLFAIDISKKALQIADKNAKNQNIEKRIKFVHGNLLDPIIKNKIVILNSQLLIASNLPYLTPNQVKKSPTIKHEPKIALVGGYDGLKYYKKLFGQVNDLRASDPRKKISIFCEIDPGQKTKIFSMAKKYFPDSEIVFKNDLAGYARLALIKVRK